MTGTEMTAHAPKRNRGASRKLRVTHYGSFPLLPGVVFQGAVLEDGRRGLIQQQMVTSLGFAGKTRSGRFERFCEKIGVKSLIYNENSEWPFVEVEMPGGGVANWIPAEALPPIIKAGMIAFGQGKLTKHQEHIGKRCSDLGTALIGVGLVALIDEASGYQHHREPDALQDIFARLIRQSDRKWDLTFHPDFYRAVCGMLGIPYGGRHRPLPPIVGQITERWVYLAVFPKEMVEEIRTRRKSGNLHLWLTEEEGLPLLKKQIAEVTTIAKSSVDRHDFEARCTQAFCKPGQQLAMIYPRAAA